MKIYFDVSCLNRPFDDQNQTRVRLESAAVSTILERMDQGNWEFIGSQMVQIEVEAIPDSVRRSHVLLLLPEPEKLVRLADADFRRAQKLESLGLKPADAVHLSIAERLAADVFLTCDDRLLRAAIRNQRQINLKVANPLTWLRENQNVENA